MFRWNSFCKVVFAGVAGGLFAMVPLASAASDPLRCQVTDLYANGSTITIDGQIQVALRPDSLKRLLKTSICPHFFGGLQEEFETEVNSAKSRFDIRTVGRAYTLSFHHEMPESPLYLTLRVPKNEASKMRHPVWVYLKRYINLSSPETRYEPVARAWATANGDLSVELPASVLDRRTVSKTNPELRYETTLLLAAISKK